MEAAEAVLSVRDLAPVRDGLQGKRPRKADEKEALVLRLLEERGRSADQVAEQLAVKPTLVRSIIRRHRRRIVQALLGQGMLLAAVADRLGFSDSFVRLAVSG